MNLTPGRILKSVKYRARTMARRRLVRELRPSQQLCEYVDYISNCTGLEPQAVVEIGAHNGNDGVFLAKSLQLPLEKCYAFEPHPRILAQLQQRHPEVKAFSYALSNREGTGTFNAIREGFEEHQGISSLMSDTLRSEEHFEPIEVEIKPTRFIFKHLGLNFIEILKIDVEGQTFEVLEGLGEEISRVGSIQLEAEHEEVWLGQKLFPDIAGYLEARGFVMVLFERKREQSDSVWVRQEFLR